MAWGYWSAHSLTPAKSGQPGSMSPAPTIQSRSREQSLERERREMEQSVCPTPARSSVCPTPSRLSICPTPGSGPALNHAGDKQGSEREYGYRTKGERSTLPRGRTSEVGDVLVERNTLPRGKSDSETGWAEQKGLTRGKSESDWSRRSTLPRGNKSGSEGEFCPACTSSRVSFQSVKNSRHSDSAPEEGKEEEVNLLSSSLPTPPPPPFQASFCQQTGGNRRGSRGVAAEIMETFSLKRNREDRNRRQTTRDSYSSHESHKSSLSHRSSEEENIDSGCKTDSTGRREIEKRTSSHTRTPSSERQFESMSEGCSKEGSSDGYQQCRYPSCPSREPESRPQQSSLKSKPCRESYASEDSRSFRNSSTGSAEEERKSAEKVVSMGKNSVFSDEADSPKEWKTFRDKDCKKLRNVEKISFNGAQVWRERGQPRGRIYSGTDSGVSPPPRRSLRSLTPDDDSISFHESLGRELIRRRRTRRRSASCSSRCEETEAEGTRTSKRLDSTNSNQSIPGASSRNSSSKSEKSSSRSSRSPSMEFSQKGCGSLQCRGRPSLR